MTLAARGATMVWHNAGASVMFLIPVLVHQLKQTIASRQIVEMTWLNVRLN